MASELGRNIDQLQRSLQDDAEVPETDDTGDPLLEQCKRAYTRLRPDDTEAEAEAFCLDLLEELEDDPEEPAGEPPEPTEEIPL